MAWYGLISAALGVLAIVTTLASADRVGLMARPALARLLVLGSSGLIWAGILLAIVGLATPALAAEAGAAATWWPADLAAGIGISALAVGIVITGVGLMEQFKLTPPLPFGISVITVAIVMAMVVSALASPAQAQNSICMPFAQLGALLKERHGLAPIGGGQVGPGLALHVFSAADGTSFTLLVVDAKSGLACILAAGRDWDPGVLPGKGT